MLLMNKRGETISDLNEEHVEELRSHLSVYEVNKIQCRLIFQNKTITLDAKSDSSCILTQKEKQVILYFRNDLSEFKYYGVATELARFVFKEASENAITTINMKLSLSIETLKQLNLIAEGFIEDSQPNLIHMRPPSPSPPPKPKEKKPNMFASILAAPFGIFRSLSRDRARHQNPSIAPVDKENIPALHLNDQTPHNKEDNCDRLHGQQHPPIQSIDHGNIRGHHRNDRRSRDEKAYPDENSPSRHLEHKRLRNREVNPDENEWEHLEGLPNPPVRIDLVEDFRPNKMEDKKLIRRIRNSQPYRNSTMTREKHIKTEICVSCVQNPTVDMVRFDDLSLPIPLYIERNLTVTDEMIDQSKQLAWVLINLATQVFKIPVQSLHLFRDINGNRIAFNSSRALFFNLRYFEQVFADDLRDYLEISSSSNVIVSTIVNFYFIVTCHELTHNIYPEHSLSFIHTLQKIIVEFMTQKESFLAQFTFDKYML